MTGTPMMNQCGGCDMCAVLRIVGGLLREVHYAHAMGEPDAGPEQLAQIELLEQMRREMQSPVRRN